MSTRLTRSRSKIAIALALAAAVAFPVASATPASAAATAVIRIASVDTQIGTDALVRIALTCASSKKCTGKVRVAAARAITSWASYSIKARSTMVVSAKLRHGQLPVSSKGRVARVEVKSRAPKRSAKITKTVRLFAATARVAIATSAVEAAKTGTVAISVTCATGANCSGTAALTVEKVPSSAVSYLVTAGATKRISLPLTAAQFAKLVKGRDGIAAVMIVERRPDALAAHTSALAVRLPTDPDPTTTPTPTPTPTQTPTPTATPVEVPKSDAYLNRNWTPTSYDTCSAALHATYSVTGPDGKLYPTWHPAQVIDPATGELCSFGHEHGTDPATSDIADWVADFFAPADGSGDHGLPFGYASEALDEHSQHSGMSMRHEDNAGHKIYVANDVSLVSADHEYVTVDNGSGTAVPITCDYLIKAHQGSHSGDATANNAHELIYAMKCSDGTEIIATTLSRIGAANEFARSCAPSVRVITTGSNLPSGDKGERIIPDRGCIETGVLGNAAGKKSDIWSIYEVWQTANDLTMADGSIVASYDPWFGIRNPSRYYDAASSTSTTNGILRTVDAAWEAPYPATGWPWSTVGSTTPYDYRDPRSPFDGARRDFYLNQSTTANPLASTIYTDPYGLDGTTEAFAGSIRQHVRTAASPMTTPLQQRKFDIEADYGKDNGVHAPN